MKITKDVIKLARQMENATIRVAAAEKELESAKRMQREYSAALPNAAHLKLSAIGLPNATVARLSNAGYTRVYEVLTLLDFPRQGTPEGIGATTLSQLKAAIEKLGNISQ